MNIIRDKKFLGGAAVIGLPLAAWLAFGFFGIHTAFIDNEVNESGPVFSASVAEQDEVAATDEFQDAMEDAQENLTEVDEDMPDMPAEEEAPADEAKEAPAEPQIVSVANGSFSGNSRYDLTGDLSVLNDGSEQRFLRFENFESDNGPDLKVYLRAENGDFVSLGALKGNIGDQNYEIPPEVDLSVFSTVEIWCERFGVGFGAAELTLA